MPIYNSQSAIAIQRSQRSVRGGNSQSVNKKRSKHRLRLVMWYKASEESYYITYIYLQYLLRLVQLNMYISQIFIFCSCFSERFIALGIIQRVSMLNAVGAICAAYKGVSSYTHTHTHCGRTWCVCRWRWWCLVRSFTVSARSGRSSGTRLVRSICVGASMMRRRDCDYRATRAQIRLYVLEW